MKYKNKKKLSILFIFTIIIFLTLGALGFSQKNQLQKNEPINNSFYNTFSDIDEGIPDPCGTIPEKLSKRLENPERVFAKKIPLLPDDRLSLIYTNCSFELGFPGGTEDNKFIKINVPATALILNDDNNDQGKITDLKLKFQIGIENITKDSLDPDKVKEVEIDDKETDTNKKYPLRQLISAHDDYELTDANIINNIKGSPEDVNLFKVHTNVPGFGLENQHLFLDKIEYKHSEAGEVKLSLENKVVPINIFSDQETPKLSNFDVEVDTTAYKSSGNVNIRGAITLEDGMTWKRIQNAFKLGDDNANKGMRLAFHWVPFNRSRKLIYQNQLLSTRKDLVGKDVTTRNTLKTEFGFEIVKFDNEDKEASFDHTFNINEIIDKYQKPKQNGLINFYKGMFRNKNIKWLLKLVIKNISPVDNPENPPTDFDKKYILAVLLPNNFYNLDISKKDIDKSTIRIDKVENNANKLKVRIYSRFANASRKKQKLTIIAKKSDGKSVERRWENFEGINNEKELDFTENKSNFPNLYNITNLKVDYAIGGESVNFSTVNNTDITEITAPPKVWPLLETENGDKDNSSKSSFKVRLDNLAVSDPNETIESVNYRLFVSDQFDGSNPKDTKITGTSSSRENNFSAILKSSNDHKIDINKWYSVRATISHKIDDNQKADIIRDTTWVKIQIAPPNFGLIIGLSVGIPLALMLIALSSWLWFRRKDFKGIKALKPKTK